MKKISIDNILAISSEGVKELMIGIASRVKERRLEMNLTQKAMAMRAGVPLATYRRFESIGEVSLKNLVLIAIILQSTGDFKRLFSKKTYLSIDDLLNKEKKRKRGKING